MEIVIHNGKRAEFSCHPSPSPWSRAMTYLSIVFLIRSHVHSKPREEGVARRPSTKTRVDPGPDQPCAQRPRQRCGT
jgi:hypothetical protein